MSANDEYMPEPCLDCGERKLLDSGPLGVNCFSEKCKAASVAWAKSMVENMTNMRLLETPIVKLTMSRRNLTTLISKLDRKARGETTFCTILLPTGNGYVEVKAVEDAEKYAAR